MKKVRIQIHSGILRQITLGQNASANAGHHQQHAQRSVGVPAPFSHQRPNEEGANKGQGQSFVETAGEGGKA